MQARATILILVIEAKGGIGRIPAKKAWEVILSHGIACRCIILQILANACRTAAGLSPLEKFLGKYGVLEKVTVYTILLRWYTFRFANKK